MLLPVEVEEASPRRFAVVGTMFAGGLFLGVFLATRFGWSPYYWQWLVYHNALVVGVVLYLILSAAWERPPPHVRVRAAQPQRRPERIRKAEPILSTRRE